MKAYRIAGWDARFENSRSKDIVNTSWVPVPNRHDGTSYRELMAREDGPQLFAAWILMVQVASRQPAPRTGVLLRGNGRPHDARSLYAATGCPADLFQTALDALSSDEWGWVEVIDLPDASTAPAPPPSAPEGDEAAPRGNLLPQGAPRAGARNGTERNGTPPPLPPAALLTECLLNYPRKAQRPGGGERGVRIGTKGKEALAEAILRNPGYPWLRAVRLEAWKATRAAGGTARDLVNFVADPPVEEEIPAERVEAPRPQEQIITATPEQEAEGLRLWAEAGKRLGVVSTLAA